LATLPRPAEVSADADSKPVRARRTEDVTELLQAWSAGDGSALERLVPVVYDELRRLARGFLRGERSGHTLQTTALVHEAYLRLIDRQRLRFEHREQFLALTAQTMRRVLVDHARGHRALKRQAPDLRDLGDATRLARQRPVDLLDLDEALIELSRLDPRQGRVVELRFFGGLTVEETARVLEISERTVKRDWRVARAHLFERVSNAAAKRAEESSS
jgi:RNA polymerase sigma factor (TIGR02999 family)